MKRIFVIFILVCLGHVVAEDKPVVAKKLKEETIEVIAEKVDNSIKTIEGEELEFTLSSSLNDIFKKNPSVSVGGGGLPLAQKVYLRGFEDSLLNVSIDGATQAGEAYHHQSRVYIDPDLLKRVQVEAGAGAATNGPGALVGAIRYETKSASDLLREGETFGGILRSAYSTNADGWKGGLTLYGKLTDDLEFVTTLSRAESGNWQDGDGNHIDNSDTNQKVGFLRLDYKIDEANRMSLSYENSSDEALRFNRPNMAVSFFHPVEPNALNQQETIRQTVIFNHYFNPEDNDLIDMRFTAYWTENEFDRSDFTSSTGGGTVESYGFDIRNTSIVGDHGLTYGLDYRHDRATVSEPNAAEDASVIGLYIQDNWRFHEDWLLSIGTRYDWYEYEDSDSVDFQDDGLSPNIGLTYFVNDYFSVYANASYVVRGTGVPESYFVARDTNDPNLKEETAENYEIGFTYDDDKLFFGAEFFRQEINEAHGEVNLGGGNIQRQNLGDLKAYGYSAYAGYRFNQDLTFTLSVSESKPELEDTALAFDSFGFGAPAGRTWVADINYAVPSLNLKLGWLSKFVETLKHVPNDKDHLGAYDVHDFYLQWLPTGEDDWTVRLSVHNIFDREYSDHTTFGFSNQVGSVLGQPDLGRDVRLEVSYKF